MEKLVPKLRFPEFEENWDKKKIGEICEVSSGGTPSRSKPNYWNGNIPWVSTTLIDFNIINKTDEYITDDGLKNSSAKIFPKGTLLMAMYGQGKTRGKTAILGIDASTNQACGAIIPNLKILNPTFLFQDLCNRYDIIRESSNQGGQENLSGTIIKSFSVTYPSLPEQQKIASFLTSVDERLTLLAQQKEKLELYKKGVMQQIFAQKLRFKDDNGENYPDWEEKKLGDLGNTFNGLTGKTKEHFGNGKPYVQYMQIFSGSKININDFGFVEIGKNENQSMIQYGDIFFTTSSETPNEIGTTSVLLDKVGEVYLNSFCFGFRPNSLNELVPEFAQFLFRSKQMRNKIVPLAQGSTRFNMSKVELMKIDLLLPCEEEQQKIASFLSAIDVQIEGVSKKIEQTKLFKKGLLQQMFV